MKNKLWLIAVVTAILFCFIACDDDTGGGGGFGKDPIADFATWLKNQEPNTAATAYTYKLNVSDLGGNSDTAGSVGKALRDNYNKYVNLDLSGSTFTSIEQYAFEYCYSLTGVTIPATVTSIGGGAFQYCSSLTSVTIGNGVTSIGQQAFSDCRSLTAINVDSGNTAYASQDGVLYNEDKTTLIKYPEGKTDTTFTIPSSVTTIEGWAFADCRSLTGVTIPDSVTSIGQYAFSNCASLTSVTIPASVTSIGQQAFSNCTSLASVTIPATVTSIGEYAFYNCTSLTSVTIPATVTSIGGGAFSGCTSLTAINVDPGNTAYSSAADGVLYNEDKTYLITYPAGKTDTTFTIPDDITYIGLYAFSGCTSLTGVTIPNSVTQIGEQAFSSCTSLTSW